MSGMQYTERDSFMGPARKGFDVTPHATNPNQTRAIMVSTDNATVTGVLEADTAPHTTFPLKAGILYQFAFKTITAVSTGTVKGYL